MLKNDNETNRKKSVKNNSLSKKVEALLFSGYLARLYEPLAAKQSRNLARR
jgi:hypothetical protein